MTVNEKRRIRVGLSAIRVSGYRFIPGWIVNRESLCVPFRGPSILLRMNSAKNLYLSRGLEMTLEDFRDAIRALLASQQISLLHARYE